MRDPIDLIASYPDLSPEELDELRRAVAADRKLAVLLEARKQLRRSLQDTLEDRRLFTLFALHRAGRLNVLNDEELEHLARHADRLERAVREHSGLEMAADDLAGAASAFSDLWDAQFDAVSQQDAGDRGAAGTAPAGADAEVAARGDRDVDRAPRENRPARHERPGARRKSRTSAYRWAVRSAIAVAIVAFAVLVTQVIERDTSMITVETAEGESQLVNIGEGSTVRLLGSSRLSYSDPQSTLMRSAMLSGRAFFEIAPEGRGFIVETATARVTVLGTSFGVDARERLTEVVLTEGSLTLARSDEIDELVVLEPGQMSRVVAGSAPTEPVDVDVPSRLSWTGLFIFQSTPLADISALLGSHFDVTIRVDESLRDERVTGTFEQTQPLREILDVIASAVGARVQPTERGFALTRP